MLVNFCGLRHLTEAVIPNIVEGGAIASIASSAGIGWLMNMEVLGALLATPDFAAAQAWCEADPKRIANGYGLSKEAINAYTAVRSFTLAPQGIRINCLNPGPTDTPMMPHFEKAVGKDFMANFPKPLWGRNARPDEQAWPLLFLNSPRASFVTGVQFDADAGFKAGMFTGQIDPRRSSPTACAEARRRLARGERVEELRGARVRRRVRRRRRLRRSPRTRGCRGSR